MAGSESALVIRWMAVTLNASAPLIALLAGDQVYARELPGNLSTVARPAVVIQHLWSDAPEGAVKTGPKTHSSQDVHVITRIVQAAHSTTLMEAVVGLIAGLLDAVHDIDRPADGYIYECHQGRTDPMLTPVGNETITEWLVNWTVTAKAY